MSNTLFKKHRTALVLPAAVGVTTLVVTRDYSRDAPIANVMGWFQIPAAPLLSLLLTAGRPVSGTWATIPECLYIHP